ncbi:MAG: thioredoxin TrxA [Pseudomonadota bacterium]|jgi:thioredoxin 1
MDSRIGCLTFLHAAMTIKHTTDDQFDTDVLQSGQPVLVDYWAEWCGPCRMIAPLLDELDKDYADKVQIVKVNVDDNPGSAQRFGIRGIPTLKLFRGGQEVATQVGAVSKAQLKAFLDNNI